MGNLADYFERNRYQPQWLIGDRVQGTWEGIPWRGTVGNDTLINETQGPRASVHLDLPLCHNKQWHTILFLDPKKLKKLD